MRPATQSDETPQNLVRTTPPGDADTPCRAPAVFFHSIAHSPQLGR